VNTVILRSAINPKSKVSGDRENNKERLCK
jgi:hypothetical protein